MVTTDLTIELGDELRRRLEESSVPMPTAGAPVRVAFVGQRTYFESSALNQATAGIEPTFIDFRLGDDDAQLSASLEKFAPHVVIVFRPETIPGRLFERFSALTIGFLTEPLPRPTAREEHPDLKRRLKYLSGVDRNNFDRIVSFDPIGVDTEATALRVQLVSVKPSLHSLARTCDL